MSFGGAGWLLVPEASRHAHGGWRCVPFVVGGGADLMALGGYEQMTLPPWRVDGWLGDGRTDATG